MNPHSTAHPSTAPAEALLPASSFLQLIRLASPALPIGGFSYSEGLEGAVDRGHVVCETSAQVWLLDQLRFSLVRSDLSLVLEAVDAARQNDGHVLSELNRWVLMTRETSELRLQTEQMGKSLALWAKNLGHDAWPIDNPCYPVAFACAAASTDASVADCALAYAFAWCEAQVGAAVRAVPLGQNAGQRILQALQIALPDCVREAQNMPKSQRQSFAPMLAIVSAQHETQYSRLFRS